jgi:hypothetical protein
LETAKQEAETQAGAERERRLSTEQRVLETCLHAAQKADRRFRVNSGLKLAGLLFVIQVFVLIFSGEWGRSAWISLLLLLAVGITSVLGLVGYWTIPDYLFGDALRRHKSEVFDREIERAGAQAALEDFIVDVEQNRITRRKP